LNLHNKIGAEKGKLTFISFFFEYLKQIYSMSFKSKQRAKHGHLFGDGKLFYKCQI
jgi:hypothetical protein